MKVKKLRSQAKIVRVQKGNSELVMVTITVVKLPYSAGVEMGTVIITD